MEKCICISEDNFLTYADALVTDVKDVICAIEYKKIQTEAPVVLMYGEGFKNVQKITFKAIASKVAVLDNGFLVRELIRGSPVGDYIPQTLYEEMAATLAKVYVRQGCIESEWL